MLAKIEKALFYVIVIVVLILLFRSCHEGANGGSGNDTLTKVIGYHYDSTLHEIAHSNTIEHYHSDTIYYPIVSGKIVIDTPAILRDYFTKYVYADTLRDTNLVAYLVDTIFKNSIFHRSFSYKILRPDKKETITLQQPARNKIFLGADLGYINNDFFTGVDLQLIDKKERELAIVVDPFRKSLLFRAGVKLSLRKTFR